MSRKVPNKVGKILMLAGLMAFTKACKKPPVPEPEPTHHYPETIYVPFELKLSDMPNVDTIRFYAQQPDVKKIIMDLKPMDSMHTSGWGASTYGKVRRMLQECIDVNPDEVSGHGTFIVHKVVPDSMNYVSGLPRSDSVAFRRMGFDIYVRRNH